MRKHRGEAVRKELLRKKARGADPCSHWGGLWGGSVSRPFPRLEEAYNAGGRRDLLPMGPPDDLQFALAIHLGRVWLVRRSGQDSTAFECRVLAANRNPVADPMPPLPSGGRAMHPRAASRRH